jgi:ABC-type nickel/cobalt efflux system permease component RcnA
MLIISIGLACLYLSIRAIYYSRIRDADKLKKFVGTKNRTFSLIIGIIGIPIGLIFLFLGIMIKYGGDK